MQSQSSSGVVHEREHGLLTRLRVTRDHPVARARVRLNIVLTLFAVVFGIVLGLRFGRVGLTVYLPGLAFALILVWAGADVVRADEREEREEEEEGRFGGASATDEAQASA